MELFASIIIDVLTDGTDTILAVGLALAASVLIGALVGGAIMGGGIVAFKKLRGKNSSDEDIDDENTEFQSEEETLDGFFVEEERPLTKKERKRQKSPGMSESGLQSTNRVYRPEVKEAPARPSSPMPKSRLSESGLQSTKLDVKPKVKKAPSQPSPQPSPKKSLPRPDSF